MTENTLNWNASTWRDSPLFADLIELLAGRLDGPEWPTREALEALLEQGPDPRTRKRLVRQDAPMSAADYELQIHEDGRIPTRHRSWHDLFNALAWTFWPLTKQALNQAHVADLARQPQQNRSRRRDALTLLDESGVVLAYTDPETLTLLSQHQWTPLFVERRNDWFHSLRPYIVGHGLHEQCLKPYVGLTAKCLPIQVDSDHFELPLRDQVAQLDRRLAASVGSSLASPAELLPLPLLGVPGWWPDQNEHFYADSNYFRPGRRTRAS
jgi:hypothetical protein